MGRFDKLETGQAAPRPETPQAAQEPQDTGTEPMSYEATMREADDLFYTGRFKEALRMYSRALGIENQHVEPWRGQVLALLLLDQTREAGVWAKRAQQYFPEHPATISLGGLIHVMQGMAERGLASSDFALARGNADSFCWLARGWMLLEADNSNWTVCLEKALAGSEVSWRDAALLGMILERYKKWPRAVECYRRALETRSDQHYLWHRLGLCCERMGMPRKAVEAQQQCLALVPDYPPAQRALHKVEHGDLLSVFKRIGGIFSGHK